MKSTRFFSTSPTTSKPARGGDKAYVLLRDALVESDKIAIAMVVIRTRQHLAAVKPQKKGLMLALMHISAEENSQPSHRSFGLEQKNKWLAWLFDSAPRHRRSTEKTNQTLQRP